MHNVTIEGPSMVAVMAEALEKYPAAKFKGFTSKIVDGKKVCVLRVKA